MYLWMLALNKCSFGHIQLSVAPPQGPLTLYSESNSHFYQFNPKTQKGLNILKRASIKVINCCVLFELCLFSFQDK